MWKLIYRLVHLCFGIAIALGVAVLLSIVAGGPLVLWLVIVVIGGVGLYVSWPRLREFAAASGLSSPQALTPQTLATSTPNGSSISGAADLTFTHSPITATLPRPSTQTATSAVWPSEWTGALGDEVRETRLISPSAVSSFWAFSRQQVLFFLALALTALVAVGIRAYQLNTLQIELYGDINLIHDYVSWIRNGDFPFRFLLSTGPFYHYMLMPFVWLFGANYDTYKLVSVLISLAGIAVTYLASRRLLFALLPASTPSADATSTAAQRQRQADWFAVLVAFVMSVSSWFLVFSRLGNSQILVPLLVMLAVWLLLRFVQDNHRPSLIWCGIASAVGLYVYPQSFILPVAIALLLILFKIAPKADLQTLAPRRAHTPITWANVFLFCIVVLICALPFPLIAANSVNAINSYIAPKLGAQHPLNILVTNIVNTLLAYHVTGDETFRSNPPNLPHLDLISGIFMVIGFVYWFRRNRLVWLALLILFVVLQVPSVLVLIEPVETPSASRTLGAAPLAYLWAASGIWWLIMALRNRPQSQVVNGVNEGSDAARQPSIASTPFLVGGVVILAILGLNLNRYFNDYIRGLPYHNTPIAKLITDYANLLPPNTQVYMAGCCWERGMPEPKGIAYEVDRPSNWHYLSKPDTLTCEKIQQYPAGSVLIWSYKNPVPTTQLLTCQNLIQPQIYSGQNGFPAFHAATLWSGPVAAASPSAPVRDAAAAAVAAADADGETPAPAASAEAAATTAIPATNSDVLLQAKVKIDGQPVTVLYSAFDIGSTIELFDKNLQTLSRGAGANPYVIELQFDEPRSLSGIALTLGTMTDVKFTASFVKADGSIETVNLQSTNLPPDPRVELKLPSGAQSLKAVRVEILDRRQPPQEGFHTHIRDVELIS